MIATLFYVAVGALAAGAVLSLAGPGHPCEASPDPGPRTAVGAAGRSGLAVQAGLSLQAGGAVVLAGAGFAVLAGAHPVGAAFTSRFTPCFGVDGLSGLFLATLGIVAAPVLGYSARYLGDSRPDRVVAALTGAFVLAMASLLCARDPITFLGSWELMTLLPAAIILIYRGADRESRATVFAYLAITHLGGAGTWVAILLLAKAGAIGSSGVIASGSGLQVAVALAALVGMGTKAGVVPLHSWLPRAHPIAPAPVSALMSGVMIKLAIYAMIRVFVDWLGVLPTWFGVLVLAVGAVSALGGVTYALFQHELKRLLALHSIENIGIIVLGLGACLVLRARGDYLWAGFALAAALLHTVNHAVFKSLLFLGAGSIERAAGSLQLDRLGGLLRRMPWTGAAFFVGAVSIAGLPPLNGFASEWLTLQALLHTAMVANAGSVYGVLALAALGATAALAVFCFVKVVGLVLLGPPRREAVAAAIEVAPVMRYAVIALAGVCVVLGVAPGLLVGRLVTLAPWPMAATTGAGLDPPGTGSLPTVGIALLIAGGTAILFWLRGSTRPAPAPTWVCGQEIGPRLNWTGTGFTKPLQLVLRPVLRPRREVQVHVEGGVTLDVSYQGEVPNLIDERIYAPVTRWSLAAAAHARRLQSGSLGTYTAYLIGLVIVVLTAGRSGWI